MAHEIAVGAFFKLAIAYNVLPRVTKGVERLNETLGNPNVSKPFIQNPAGVVRRRTGSLRNLDPWEQLTIAAGRPFLKAKARQNSRERKTPRRILGLSTILREFDVVDSAPRIVDHITTVETAYLAQTTTGDHCEQNDPSVLLVQLDAAIDDGLQFVIIERASL